MKNQKKSAKLLSDECVPEIINKLFENNSISITRVRDLNLRGNSDETIYKKALNLKLAILTLDVKFANQLHQLHHFPHGIILIRHKGKVDSSLLSSLQSFINKDIKNVKMSIIVIEKQKYKQSKNEQNQKITGF